jgi:hypothetical protein
LLLRGQFLLSAENTGGNVLRLAPLLHARTMKGFPVLPYRALLHTNLNMIFFRVCTAYEKIIDGGFLTGDALHSSLHILQKISQYMKSHRSGNSGKTAGP